MEKTKSTDALHYSIPKLTLSALPPPRRSKKTPGRTNGGLGRGKGVIGRGKGASRGDRSPPGGAKGASVVAPDGAKGTLGRAK